MKERDAVLEILSVGRAAPFEYEHATRIFHLGESSLAPDDIPEYGYIHNEESKSSEVIEEWNRTKSFLMLRNPISTAAGRTAIESIWSRELRDETREIMADVLIEQRDGSGEAMRSWRDGLIKNGSFGAEKIQAGEVFVQTVGSCACLGVDYTVHNYWRSVGFSEYTQHNIDNRAQRASVLAGLGHIAFVANRYIQAAH